MPVPTVQDLQNRERSLANRLSEKGESLAADRRRGLQKKLRRVQRKQRRFRAELARRAAMSAKPAEGQGGEASATQS